MSYVAFDVHIRVMKRLRRHIGTICKSVFDRVISILIVPIDHSGLLVHGSFGRNRKTVGNISRHENSGESSCFGLRHLYST